VKLWFTGPHMNFDQFSHEGCPIVPDPACCHLDRAPVGERFAGQKQVANPFAMIFAILFGYRFWLAEQRLAYFGEQLFADLIQANLRIPPSQRSEQGSPER